MTDVTDRRYALQNAIASILSDGQAPTWAVFSTRFTSTILALGDSPTNGQVNKALLSLLGGMAKNIKARDVHGACIEIENVLRAFPRERTYIPKGK